MIYHMYLSTLNVSLDAPRSGFHRIFALQLFDREISCTFKLADWDVPITPVIDIIHVIAEASLNIGLPIQVINQMIGYQNQQPAYTKQSSAIIIGYDNIKLIISLQD